MVELPEPDWKRNPEVDYGEIIPEEQEVKEEREVSEGLDKNHEDFLILDF